MKGIILLSFLVPASLLAQSAVRVQCGKSTEIATGNPLASYWGAGLVVSAATDFDITEQIALAPTFQYSHHSFKSSPINTIPENILQSASGSSSNVYRLWLDARASVFPRNTFNFGFSFGIGWTSEQMGKIHATWQHGNQTQPAREFTYPSENYVTYSASFFLSLRIIDRVGLAGSARCFVRSERRFTFVPTIGLQWNFTG